MSNLDREAGVFALGFVLGVLGLLFGLVLPFCELSSYSNFLRQEAVERGYAEWRVIQAHDGTTEFRWLDKPSTAHGDPIKHTNH